MKTTLKRFANYADRLFERIGWMWLCVATSLILLALVLPFNWVLGTSWLWALCKLNAAAAAGYGFDWAAFRHDDPRDKEGLERTMAQTRRATLMAAAVIAMGLIG